MNLIAFDTSTDYLSVAVATADDILLQETLAEQKHSQLLLPWLEQLLSRASLTMSGIDAIAYGNGPGSFTGLRIGAGVAQGLALGSGKPLIPVCGLLALAEASERDAVVACLDARMGQVYLAAYRKHDGDWAAVIEPGLYDLTAPPALPGGTWTGVGNGFDRCAGLVAHYGDALGEVLPGRHPCAAAMTRLAARRYARGEYVDAGQAELVYLRDKVAQTLAERGKI